MTSTKHALSINALDAEVVSDDDLRDESPLIKQELPGSSSDESNVLVIRCSRMRWYVLGIFSLLSFLQACVWNSWAPISQSTFKAFPTWNNTMIAVLANWGNITYILFVIPICWIMDRYGLRIAVLLTATLQVVGSGVRCITTEETTSTILINVGQFLNGMAGVVACSAPPLVSASWFPPEERTTATSVAILFNTLGTAVSFVLGPLIVNERQNSTNSTTLAAVERDVIKNEIMHLMYIEFGLTVLISMFAFAYFPSKPSIPPSISASLERHAFRESFTKLFRNPQVWIIAVPYFVAMAIFGTWLSVLDLSLASLGISQITSGWIGFYTSLAACGGGFIVARFTDLLKGKRMKLSLLIGMIMFTALTVWFTLMYTKVLPYKSGFLYASIVLMGFFNSSMMTLIFELEVEISHPVHEGLVGGFLTGLWNVVGGVFLLVFFIPNIGVQWMNWLLIASGVFTVPFVFLIKENYVRYNLDKSFD